VDHAYGITWASRAALSEPYQLVASRVGLTGGVQIWGTVPGLAAARAEIDPGISVVAVNGKPADDFETLSHAIQPSWESGRLRLELRGSGDEPIRDITLRGEKACRYTLTLLEEDSVNGLADGDRVLVAEGMMRFADRDEELALVVGHEIAHNALDHVREKQVTRGIGRGFGTVFDVAIGLVVPTGGAFGRLGEKVSDAATSGRSRDFESDADYMGLYMARRAGSDISEAHLFWREMAAEYPDSIEGSMAASHPSTPQRSSALTAAVAEIRTKEKASQPRVPERIPEPANAD